MNTGVYAYLPKEVDGDVKITTITYLRGGAIKQTHDSKIPLYQWVSQVRPKYLRSANAGRIRLTIS